VRKLIKSHHFSFKEVDIFEFVKCDGRSEVARADVKRSDGVIHARQQNSSWKINQKLFELRCHELFTSAFSQLVLFGHTDQFF